MIKERRMPNMEFLRDNISDSDDSSDGVSDSRETDSSEIYTTTSYINHNNDNDKDGSGDDTSNSETHLITKSIKHKKKNKFDYSHSTDSKELQLSKHSNYTQNKQKIQNIDQLNVFNDSRRSRKKSKHKSKEKRDKKRKSRHKYVDTCCCVFFYLIYMYIFPYPN